MGFAKMMQSMISSKVAGSFPGQSQGKPALCRRRLAMVVLVFLLVSQLGQYLVTRSVNFVELLLNKFIRQQVEATSLVIEAMSYFVQFPTSTSWIWLEQQRQPKFLRQMIWVQLATVTLPPGNTLSLMAWVKRSFNFVQSGAELAVIMKKTKTAQANIFSCYNSIQYTKIQGQIVGVCNSPMAHMNQSIIDA